jgi:cytochrome c oxidase subunit I+III
VVVTPHQPAVQRESARDAARAVSAADRIRQTWEDRGGFRGRLTTVQNGAIGKGFIGTAFFFFLVAGVQALLMRVQLARPENTFLDPETFNQLFTMHGTTMMFIFAVPIMEAFANVLLPPMLGARELPFPRMTSFGYWSYAAGAVLFYSSYLVGAVPDGGWFGYVPLTGPTYSPGLGIDFWLLGLSVAEVAAMGAGVELVVAVLKMRAGHGDQPDATVRLVCPGDGVRDHLCLHAVPGRHHAPGVRSKARHPFLRPGRRR